MPNITGTTGNDDINVTDDDGTLNGDPQGTPIDNIRGRGGNDTISVEDSTIANDVRGNGGSDDISISGSQVSGFVHGGSGEDTVSVGGSDVGNIRLGNGNDTLDFISTTVTGDVRGGSGTDSLNLPVGTIVNDATFGTFTVTVGGSYNLSSGSFALPSGISVNYATFENGTGVPCFASGTLIRAEKGDTPAEQLKVGDAIPTLNNGLQRIRWVGTKSISGIELVENPKLRPVRISSGALGQGLPTRDLLVSRQHRMWVSSKIAERMFGSSDVLIHAIKLVGLPGVYVDEKVDNVEYVHLLFDRHEIIFAEGAATESLYTGKEALRSLSPEAKQEIVTLFPEVLNLEYKPQPACMIPSGSKQKALIARHFRNRKPVCG